MVGRLVPREYEAKCGLSKRFHPRRTSPSFGSSEKGIARWRKRGDATSIPWADSSMLAAGHLMWQIPTGFEHGSTATSFLNVDKRQFRLRNRKMIVFGEEEPLTNAYGVRTVNRKFSNDCWPQLVSGAVGAETVPSA